MEKVRIPNSYQLDKIEQYREEKKELTDLRDFCFDWSILHYWESLDRERLSPEKAELHDIAKVLYQYLKGRDPFEQLTKNKIDNLPLDFTLRVAAVLLTKNKMIVSDFFSLPDDSKTLNSTIATRAAEFCPDEELEGLTIAQKANLTLKVIEENRGMRKDIIAVFMLYFDHLLEQKRSQDVTYNHYSFRQWVRMASKSFRKGK
ncbi:hypothetical protein ACVV7M_003315 [Vibrio vulnificus]